MNVLKNLYLFSKIVRQTLLFSVFGIVSSCKHTPTCGEYFVKKVREKGVITGIRLTVPRILACY